MISVVIPTFNAERTLPRCFDSLIAAAVRGVLREVIVADGGSSDATLEIADAAGAHILQVRRPVSRAELLIAGAAAARSDWLLFLRADTALEPGWDLEVESFLAQSGPEFPRAAVFRFALDEFGGRARRAEVLTALRGGLLGLPYGDQGLLISKRFYRKLGGYRPLAGMEDADLVRRIARHRLVKLRARAVNLALRRQSAWRGVFLSLLHALRVPARIVARL